MGKSNEMLSKFTSMLKEVKTPREKTTFPGKPKIVVSGFFPNSATDDVSYYSYEGGLTTPPCTEGVKWIILLNPSHIDVNTLYKFETLKRCKSGEGDNGQYLERGNFRPTQNLNGRRVSLHTDLLF